MSQLQFDWVVPTFKKLPETQNYGLDNVLQKVPTAKGKFKLQGTCNVTTLVKSLQHQGITIDLIGVLITNERKCLPFYTQNQVVQPPGALQGQQAFKFDFKKVELPCESSSPQRSLFKLKYYLVCNVKQAKKDIQGQYEFHYIEQKPQQQSVPVKSEVGAENALQIELDCVNTCLDLNKDYLTSSIHFVTAQKKMLEARIIIRRREIYRQNAGDQPIVGEFTDILNYQIMDGPPVRNEVIPVKILLSQVDQLTPSVKTDICKIEHQMLLNVVDNDGQNYFKETQVSFYRGEQQDTYDE